MFKVRKAFSYDASTTPVLSTRFSKRDVIQSILFALVLLLGSIENAQASGACSIFDKNQRDVLQRAYNYGKQSDLGWTLAAIAWRESSAGADIVNFNDPSFGVFQVHLKTASSHEGFDWHQDPQRALMVAQRLITDFEYGADHAIQVLEFWKRRHKGNYRKMLASYNAGYRYAKGAGQAYAKDVASKVNYLRTNKCVI